jgi:hypothetical protein
MSESAKITAIDIINDFRVALLNFGEEATEALCAAEAEIRRTEEWLQDQLKSWQQEVRQGEDAVFQAKTELTRRKMMTFGDRPVDTTEQELALRRAVARLEHAEDLVEATRQWIRAWPKAVVDFRGPSGQLKGLLEGELPRASAFLERKIAALDAYVSASAPRAPSPNQDPAPASTVTPQSVPGQAREERPTL